MKPILLAAIPELALGLLVYLGILFKILYLPFANLVLTISLLSLGSLYMILGWLLFSNTNLASFTQVKKNNYQLLKIGFGVFSGLFMSVVSVCCWEYIMRLPPARIMMVAAIVFFVALTIVAISLSIKYQRFALVYLRVVLSLIFVSFPIIAFIQLLR